MDRNEPPYRVVSRERRLVPVELSAQSRAPSARTCSEPLSRGGGTGRPPRRSTARGRRRCGSGCGSTIGRRPAGTGTPGAVAARAGCSRRSGSPCGCRRPARSEPRPVARTASVRGWRRRGRSPRRRGCRGRPRGRSADATRAGCRRRVGRATPRSPSRDTSSSHCASASSPGLAALERRRRLTRNAVSGRTRLPSRPRMIATRSRCHGSPSHSRTRSVTEVVAAVASPSTSGAPGSRSVLVTEPVAPGSVDGAVVAPGSGAAAGIV